MNEKTDVHIVCVARHMKMCTSVFSFMPQGNEKKTTTVNSYNLISYHFHTKSKVKQP